MTDYRVAKCEAQEITASIETLQRRFRLVLSSLALGSMALSVALQAARKQHESLFVGNGPHLF
jgi:hypothetical protein